MLAATIKISSIDYENTLQHIFPVVSEKVLAMNSKRMIVRLFQELKGDSLPILIGVAHRLPEDTKNELLICGLNAYAPVLKEKLNEELQKDKWGRCFTIGTISVERRDGILLDIGQIEVDYQALLNNEHVTGAIENRLGKFSPFAKAVAGVATVFAGNTIERKGLELLWQDDNRKRLLELVKAALEKYGIKIEVDEIQIMQVEKAAEGVIEASRPFTLTEKMEDHIISALARYLRDNVVDGQGER